METQRPGIPPRIDGAAADSSGGDGRVGTTANFPNSDGDGPAGAGGDPAPRVAPDPSARPGMVRAGGARTTPDLDIPVRVSHRDRILPMSPTLTDNGDGGTGSDPSLALLQGAPPWLISLIVHTVALIVLGLLVVPSYRDARVTVQAVFAEAIGDQLDDDTVHLSTDPLPELEQQLVTPDSLPPTEIPFAAPPDFQVSLRPNAASSQKDAPMVGLALTGREKGLKKALLAAYGGNATTEAAVHRALLWLQRNQRRDGSWSLVGPYQNGGQGENQIAATAMALLAFQGAGHTHESGEFKDEVAKGWKWLLRQQNEYGDFWKRGTYASRNTYNHRLYSQAQASIALCELYGMTRDEDFRGPAKLVIDYAVKTQGRHGGWRYQPGAETDTSVTGWFVMALQSGMMAGLTVPSPTLDRISEYLDTVASGGGSLYSYRVGRPPTTSMTAEALLCRQYLGWRRDDSRLTDGVKHLLANPIKWEDQDVYYWYYATQVAHHMEGAAWDQWNAVMRQAVPQHQIIEGREQGSWSPDRDQWGIFGGRLYVTCLCVYMLEVYYRHLPIYSPLYQLGK